MEPPTTQAICRTPRWSRTILWMLSLCGQPSVLTPDLFSTHLTSSRIVVKGNSGPYCPRAGSPSLFVTGLALPYGLPRLFRQIMKNLVTSKARPGPPINGPHQSATSALPLRAWHMTRALSLFSESWPRVVYATGTFLRVTPDSRVKEGTMAKSWSGTSCAKGFSGWPLVLSTGFSSRSTMTRPRRGGACAGEDWGAGGGVTDGGAVEEDGFRHSSVSKACEGRGEGSSGRARKCRAEWLTRAGQCYVRSIGFGRRWSR